MGGGGKYIAMGDLFTELPAGVCLSTVSALSCHHGQLTPLEIPEKSSALAT